MRAAAAAQLAAGGGDADAQPHHLPLPLLQLAKVPAGMEARRQGKGAKQQQTVNTQNMGAARAQQLPHTPTNRPQAPPGGWSEEAHPSGQPREVSGQTGAGQGSGGPHRPPCRPQEAASRVVQLPQTLSATGAEICSSGLALSC